MKDERVMIACCSDGTRPVIFKIERLDYKVLFIDGANGEDDRQKIKSVLEQGNGVSQVVFLEDYAEVYLEKDVEDRILKDAVEQGGEYRVFRID